jgi:hypothetical protein
MKYNKQPYKERHQLPPPEEILAKYPMAFTVNINDTSNTLTVHPRYQALLQKISNYADVDMFYEYSKSFKLHMHGWLTIQKKSNILPLYCLLNDTVIKNNFTYCLKSVFTDNTAGEYDPEPWDKYIKKQKHLTKEYLQTMNINYHTIINQDNPIGKIFKYITVHDELTASLDETI